MAVSDDIHIQFQVNLAFVLLDVGYFGFSDEFLQSLNDDRCFRAGMRAFHGFA